MDARAANDVVLLLTSLVELGLGLALLVYADRRLSNVLLAGFFLLSGATLIDHVYVLRLFGGGPALTYNAGLWGDGVDTGSTFFYVAFCAQVLPVGFLRPFRSRVGIAALIAGFVAFVAAHFVAPGIFFGPPSTLVDGVTVWSTEPGLTVADNTILVVGFGLGAVATAVAITRSQAGSIARRQAWLYALAFGVQDVSITAWNGLDAMGVQLGSVSRLVYSLLLLLAVLLTAYALVRFQVYDLSLRVKGGIRRGSVALAFLAVFVVVTAIAQQLLQESAGPYVGAAAAGLLVFALQPIQRAAERVANKAMPDVQPTEGYLLFKKLEVYRAALESAYELDASIDARERGRLDKLREKLGLGAHDTAALEADVARTFAPDSSVGTPVRAP